jgi:hypothetical protein
MIADDAGLIPAQSTISMTFLHNHWHPPASQSQRIIMHLAVFRHVATHRRILKYLLHRRISSCFLAAEIRWKSNSVLQKYMVRQLGLVTIVYSSFLSKSASFFSSFSFLASSGLALASALSSLSLSSVGSPTT